MSEQSQGPGWWQASDGKWYPPEQAAAVPPTAPVAGGPIPAAAAGGGGNGKVIAAIVALVVLAGAAVFFITRDSGSSGSVSAFCAEVKKADALLTGQPLSKTTADAFIAEFDKLDKAAPKEIKADMDTLNAAAKKSGAAVKAGKVSDDIFSSSEQTKLDQAGSRVNAFSKTKCGVDLDGASDGNSDTNTFSLGSEFSESFSDFSDFGSDFSDSFSDFDSDFLSSLDSDFFSSDSGN